MAPGLTLAGVCKPRRGGSGVHVVAAYPPKVRGRVQLVCTRPPNSGGFLAAGFGLGRHMMATGGPVCVGWGAGRGLGLHWGAVHLVGCRPKVQGGMP